MSGVGLKPLVADAVSPRAPDHFRYITDARWQEIEKLLAKLGVDANAVIIDWQYQAIDPAEDPPSPQRLRDELEEISDRYLNFPKFLTRLQIAKALRKTLGKIEDVLADSAFPTGLRKVYGEDVEAPTAFADKLRSLIADCEAEGSSSAHNAAKETRNACWCELAQVWQKATAAAQKRSGRGQRYDFIYLSAPAPFTPRSESELNRALERLRQSN